MGICVVTKFTSTTLKQLIGRSDTIDRIDMDNELDR